MRIQQESIKKVITETGYEGTGLYSRKAGNVNLQDFVDTLVLCQVARKERFCDHASVVSGCKEGEIL